jgi:hypothetical protein
MIATTRKYWMWVPFVVAIACGGQTIAPAEDLFAKRKLCADVGRNFYAIQLSETAMLHRRALEPEFSYSETLKTCLLAGGYADDQAGATVHFVRDALSNRTMATYTESTNNPSQTSAAKREFEGKMRELMPEPAAK